MLLPQPETSTRSEDHPQAVAQLAAARRTRLLIPAQRGATARGRRDQGRARRVPQTRRLRAAWWGAALARAVEAQRLKCPRLGPRWLPARCEATAATQEQSRAASATY